MKLTKGQRLGDWTVVEELAGARHVALTVNSHGAEGVLKTSRGRGYFEQRFHEEVHGMQELRGHHGVLQLLDADQSSSPRWMVTERAVLLTEQLGPEPDLWTVVHLFEQMASSLTRLETQRIAHRDLKPPNMFVLRGNAVIGDFGIATWPGRPADITEDGRGVGPMHFMAPEAREYHDGLDPFPADVYALAASLWAAAAGKRYPPLGVLGATREAASLYSAGGEPAHELARLLELATADRPYDRPRMRELRDELRHWMSLHPEGSVPAPEVSPYGAYFPQMRHSKDHAGEPWDVSDRCVRDLLNALRHLGPSGSQGSEMDKGKTGELQGDYGDEDRAAAGWEPEWTTPVRTLTWSGHPWRIVAMAYGEGKDEQTYLVEWHHNLDGPWKLAWHGSDTARLRLPSDYAVRSRLADLIQTSDPRGPMPTGEAAPHDETGLSGTE
jgi:serine/threonine-protein kinase